MVSMRRWLPERWAFLRLLMWPSSYLLVIALLATLVWKAQVIAGLADVDGWFVAWLGSACEDVAVFFGVAALLAAGERSPWMQALTIPVAFAIAAIALLNVAYMGIAGEQITWPVISIGISRLDDVRGIAAESLVLTPAMIAVAIAALWMPALVAYWLVPGLPHAAAARERAKACAWVALIGALLAVIVPEPATYALRRLHGNAVARAWHGLLTGSEWTGSATFTGYTPRELAAVDGAKRWNVVVIVLESTPRHATGPARTPNLAALAARGVDFTAARAVIPHTSKSLWSMMCGRLPLMQPGLVELTELAALECLPRVLARAGWRTLFAQSAVGTFEDRPRLVDKLGYAEFLAAEDIGGERLAYVASDDESLAAPFAQWAAGGEPFFATLLTSATHHPYITPQAMPASADDRARFDMLVTAADRMVGRVVATIAERGLADRTIIVVAGDHGEGFGEKGVRQHATNFYEEGLRVPLVVVAPGLAPRRIDTPVTLVDVTPTILSLLGARVTPTAPAANAVDATPSRVLPFGCWYDTSCRGYVRDSHKAVFIPETGQSFWFDLARDPHERVPQPFTEEIARVFRDVDALVDAHRVRDWSRAKPAMTTYPRWDCAANQGCRPRPR